MTGDCVSNKNVRKDVEDLVSVLKIWKFWYCYGRVTVLWLLPLLHWIQLVNGCGCAVIGPDIVTHKFTYIRYNRHLPAIQTQHTQQIHPLATGYKQSVCYFIEILKAVCTRFGQRCPVRPQPRVS